MPNLGSFLTEAFGLKQTPSTAPILGKFFLCYPQTLASWALTDKYEVWLSASYEAFMGRRSRTSHVCVSDTQCAPKRILRFSPAAVVLLSRPTCFGLQRAASSIHEGLYSFSQVTLHPPKQPFRHVLYATCDKRATPAVYLSLIHI